MAVLHTLVGLLESILDGHHDARVGESYESIRHQILARGDENTIEGMGYSLGVISGEIYAGLVTEAEAFKEGYAVARLRQEQPDSAVETLLSEHLSYPLGETAFQLHHRFRNLYK
ncbi:hypothetical protein HY496_01810 [Candidatus Woesearchaeota archaeon]|nr:hypothetical protein [Candidatus Woesearchaeota archaeon]